MSTFWQGRRVVVCVGTGGVGKTTVAATLAVAAAQSGLKTLVMTIDPARRLANALGLKDVGDAPQRIDEALLKPFGVQLRAPLYVMMPDVKATFDSLVRRWAADDVRAQKIFNNRIYQHFSTALAGSHEYAAVEKLYEVYTANRYDLIILDTPPSQNVIEFLEAPGRILDFLDHDTVNWLLKPTLFAGRLSLKILNATGSVMFKTLSRLAGAETLRELIEFLLDFQEMYDGFRTRSRHVKDLLASDALAFLLVTSPKTNQQRSMQRFRDELKKAQLTVRGVIVNRVRVPLAASGNPELGESIAQGLQRALRALPESDVAHVVDAVAEEIELASRDRATVETLRHSFADVPVVALPELPLDAHDLASLATLQRSI